MTQPDPTLDISLQLANRPSYLTLLPLREETLARATDINTIQTNVDDALRLFASDVSTTLQAMLQALVYRMMALERKEAAFEVQIEGEFADYRQQVDAALAELRADLEAAIEALRDEVQKEVSDLRDEVQKEVSDLRDEVRKELDDLTEMVTTKLSELQAYIDKRVDQALADAKAYTDTREYRILRLLWEMAAGGVVFDSPVIGDGGNYFGGKGWDFVIGTIPNGTTLYVYGWKFDWTTTGDAGGAADDLQIFWPNFLGQRTYHDGGNQHEEMMGSGAPMFGIRGPFTLQAGIYINNLKGRGRFTIVGKLIPVALESIALANGWDVPTAFLNGKDGADEMNGYQAWIASQHNTGGGIYNMAFGNLSKGTLGGQAGWTINNGAFTITTNGLEIAAPISDGAFLGASHDLVVGTKAVEIIVQAGQPMLWFMYQSTTKKFYAAWFVDANTLDFGVRVADKADKTSGAPLILGGSGPVQLTLGISNTTLTLTAKRMNDNTTVTGSMEVEVFDTPRSMGITGASATIVNFVAR